MALKMPSRASPVPRSCWLSGRQPRRLPGEATAQEMGPRSMRAMKSCRDESVAVDRWQCLGMSVMDRKRTLGVHPERRHGISVVSQKWTHGAFGYPLKAVLLSRVHSYRTSASCHVSSNPRATILKPRFS